MHIAEAQDYKCIDFKEVEGQCALFILHSIGLTDIDVMLLDEHITIAYNAYLKCLRNQPRKRTPNPENVRNIEYYGKAGKSWSWDVINSAIREKYPTRSLLLSPDICLIMNISGDQFVDLVTRRNTDVTDILIEHGTTGGFDVD